jgi:hypothetical protein
MGTITGFCGGHNACSVYPITLKFAVKEAMASNDVAAAWEGFWWIEEMSAFIMEAGG